MCMYVCVFWEHRWLMQRSAQWRLAHSSRNLWSCWWRLLVLASHSLYAASNQTSSSGRLLVSITLHLPCRFTSIWSIPKLSLLVSGNFHVFIYFVLLNFCLFCTYFRNFKLTSDQHHLFTTFLSTLNTGQPKHGHSLCAVITDYTRMQKIE